MLKARKLSHLIKEIKQNNRKEQPKERVAKQRITQSFSPNLEIFFPPLGEDEGTKGPMIIEAEIEGHYVRRIYVNGGSASEITYEHCFSRLRLEIKKQLIPATTPLIGFSGEIIWLIGQIQLLVKIRDEEHSALAWMNFMVVRSQSLYNGIIGRPRVRKLQAVLSTTHGMLKIPVEGGVVRQLPALSISSICFLRVKHVTPGWHSLQLPERFLNDHSDLHFRCCCAPGPETIMHYSGTILLIHNVTIPSVTGTNEIIISGEKVWVILCLATLCHGCTIRIAACPSLRASGHAADMSRFKPFLEVPSSARAASEAGIPESCGICSFPSVFRTTDVGWLRGVCSMHAGTRSVVAKALQTGYYLPTMHGDAWTLIRACQDFQVHKPVLRNPQQKLTPITSPWAFYKWGIDIAGPFLEGPEKVKFLIVAMDYFIKWIEPKPVVIITGNQIKKNCGTNVVCRFGLPREISQIMENSSGTICLKIGAKNYSLGEGIKARLDARIIPTEISMPTLKTTEVDLVGNNIALEINLDLLEERREEAAIREAKSKAKMEKYYNSKVRNTSFKPRDLVYRNNDASRVEDIRKLGPKWEGPYKVMETLGKGAYKLRDRDGTQLPRTWNISNLKKCHIHKM
nr:hypothetical protein [Tanacetum cinerariifolium]